MMNEYKQELSSAVKSALFKLRKHRWDRIYYLFTQRSSMYAYSNVVIVLTCLHGLCDLISMKLLKFFEYCVVWTDVLSLLGLGCFLTYGLLFNWCLYLLFRILGFSITCLVEPFVDYLAMFVWCFRFYVQRRILKVTVGFILFIRGILDAVQYLTIVSWRSQLWRTKEPLQLFRFLCYLQHDQSSVISRRKDAVFLCLMNIWISLESCSIFW